MVELGLLRQLVPPLSGSAYKGQAGKVGVLGGCAEYTGQPRSPPTLLSLLARPHGQAWANGVAGAPFYAAIAALKLGCDLSHVFCDEAAAGPIKSYSPELIVHGCLREGQCSDDSVRQQVEAVRKWFPALTALVVGPGLGRDETLQAVAQQVLESAAACSLPCVVDADGLWPILNCPQLVQGSRWTVLTPNKPEYERLMKVFPDIGQAGANALEERDLLTRNQDLQHLALCRALNGPVLVRKGAEDLISDGRQLLRNVEPGCPKRSGGQGDVLAGTIATFLSWAKAGEKAARLPVEEPHSAPLLAAYAGCLLTRRFSSAAFARHRRAMTAPDLIEAIGPVFEDFYPATIQ